MEEELESCPKKESVRKLQVGACLSIPVACFQGGSKRGEGSVTVRRGGGLFPDLLSRGAEHLSRPKHENLKIYFLFPFNPAEISTRVCGSLVLSRNTGVRSIQPCSY